MQYLYRFNLYQFERKVNDFLSKQQLFLKRICDFNLKSYGDWGKNAYLCNVE